MSLILGRGFTCKVAERLSEVFVADSQASKSPLCLNESMLSVEKIVEQLDNQ